MNGIEGIPMIEEIRPIQPDATLFPGAQLTMVTTSIAAGNTNGQLWRAADGRLVSC